MLRPIFTLWNRFGAGQRESVAEPRLSGAGLAGPATRNRLSVMLRSGFQLFSCLLLATVSLPAQRTIPVQNEFVRVVSVVDPHVAKPGNMHVHEQNRVMIYLDAGDINIRYEDGKAEDQHWKAGDVGWSPASGRHTSQHVSEKPTRIVEIELQKPGTATGAAKSSTVKGAALLDNAQVRVYRSKVAPPAGSNYVAVNMDTAETVWNRLPSGVGPFVITLLK